MASVQYESPIPVENGLQHQVLVTSSLSIAVPSIFVGLRFYAKISKMTKPLDLTGLCLVIALLINIGLHIDYFLLVLKGDMGFRPAEILTRFGPEPLVFFGKVSKNRDICKSPAIAICKLTITPGYRVRRLLVQLGCLHVQHSRLAHVLDSYAGPENDPPLQSLRWSFHPVLPIDCYCAFPFVSASGV